MDVFKTRGSMKNRAKCKKCESIIESFHRHDYVTCACGEISVDGGQDYYRCRATDWNNFLRVDDEGNVIVPVIKDKITEQEKEESPVCAPKPTKEELMSLLDEQIKSYEKMPSNAVNSSVTHYDLLGFMYLMQSILSHKDEIKRWE